jgi:Starch-binding associating with outer membrane
MKFSNLYILGVVAALLLAQACTQNFDDININPNAPTTVNSGLLLPQIERDMMGAILGEAWGIGNIVIQHTAKNQFVNEDRYLWGDLTGLWNAVYDNMRDVNNIIALSEANGENNYKGIALVLRAWMFSIATDAYGDIPYTDAIRAKEGLNYTTYDPQETVYNGILNDLKTANDILGTSGEVVAGDIIFGGSTEKWRKLANSLRVRYLLRISRKKDVSADLRAIVDNASTNPIFADKGDNAVYSFSASAPDQFPLHLSRIGSFNEFRASKTLLDTLQSLNDPRMKVFFRATPDSEGKPTEIFVGLPNGLNDVAALEFNGGPQFQSRIGSLYYENAVTTQGLSIAKGVVMTYAELQFLLAEAAERGLIGGSAETFYNNGVTASYAFYGLTPAPDFLTRTEVAYTGNNAEKLNKIGFQKWVSLYFQGMEAWFDWRRTGIPALKAGPSNQNNDLIPVRFRYPIIEQSLNNANYTTAVSRQGADDLNTKMWYLK